MFTLQPLVPSYLLKRDREKETGKKLNTNPCTLRAVMCERKLTYVTTLRPTTKESAFSKTELVYDLVLQPSYFMIVTLVILYFSNKKAKYS